MLFIKVLLISIGYISTICCTNVVKTLYMFWTTSIDSFKERNVAVFDSYLHFHPDLRIKIFSVDGLLFSRLRVSDYVQRGYMIEFAILDQKLLENLADECPNGEWLLDDKHKTGNYYYSHLSDFLRFCFLLKTGGIYSDFDALLINPIPKEILNQTGLTVGSDKISINEKCLWCLGQKKDTYLAPGLLIAGSAGLDILNISLRYGFSLDTYKAHIFNHAGPLAFNQAYKDLPLKSTVNILPPFMFYPISYWVIINHFKSARFESDLYYSIKRSSLSVHFYGGLTKNESIEDMSLISRLFPQPILSKHSADIEENCFLSDSYTYSSLLRCFSIRFENVKTYKIECEGKPSTNITGNQMKINQQLKELEVGPVKSSNIILMAHPEVLSAPYYLLKKDLTIILKPFGRLYMIQRFFRSAREIYPFVKILIGNDGKSFGNDLELADLDVIQLPYDYGLSNGRNLLITNYLHTPYFFLIDEDFIFLREKSDLALLLHQFIRYKLDILSGCVRDDEYDYIGKFKTSKRFSRHLTDGRTLWMLPIKRNIQEEIQLVDFVPNVFIAHKGLLDKIKWNSELKIGEHEDFFWNAKKLKLNVGASNIVHFFHHQDQTKSKTENVYKSMRSRVFNFLVEALRINGWSKLKLFGNTVISKSPESYHSQILFAELYFDRNSMILELHSSKLPHGVEIISDDPYLYKYIHDHEFYKRNGTFFVSSTLPNPLKLKFNNIYLRSLNHTSSCVSPLQLAFKHKNNEDDI